MEQGRPSSSSLTERRKLEVEAAQGSTERSDQNDTISVPTTAMKHLADRPGLDFSFLNSIHFWQECLIPLHGVVLILLDLLKPFLRWGLFNEDSPWHCRCHVAKGQSMVSSESRKCRMHPDLLYSVTKNQAGSIGKAIRERGMNSIEAGVSSLVSSSARRRPPHNNVDRNPC